MAFERQTNGKISVYPDKDSVFTNGKSNLDRIARTSAMRAMRLRIKYIYVYWTVNYSKYVHICIRTCNAYAPGITTEVPNTQGRNNISRVVCLISPNCYLPVLCAYRYYGYRCSSDSGIISMCVRRTHLIQ